MAKMTRELVVITPLLKGSDLDRNKIVNYILSKDKYHVFYKLDLMRKFNIGEYKLRGILADLEKQKVLVKIKSYPVFWERILK